MDSTKKYNMMPSQLFDYLRLHSSLTNQVSIDALTAARRMWLKHTLKKDNARTVADIHSVLAKLKIVVNQIVNRRCRINPIAYNKLVLLVKVLNYACANKVNLEPYKPLVAANDSVDKAVA